MLLISISNVWSQKYTEYEVKAVFLVNFGKFVQWPINRRPDKPFVLGIYGKNPFGDIFDNPAFKNATINDREYVVKKFTNIDEIKCDMLFITGTDKYETIQIINRLKNKPTLTVGDNIEEFCEKGGIVNFTEKGNRYRFEINNNAALDSDIKISSKLLNLAKIVEVNEVKF